MYIAIVVALARPRDNATGTKATVITSPDVYIQLSFSGFLKRHDGRHACVDCSIALVLMSCSVMNVKWILFLVPSTSRDKWACRSRSLVVRDICSQYAILCNIPPPSNRGLGEQKRHFSRHRSHAIPLNQDYRAECGKA